MHYVTHDIVCNIFFVHCGLRSQSQKKILNIESEISTVERFLLLVSLRLMYHVIPDPPDSFELVN